MKKIILKASKRDIGESLKALRNLKMIPCVIYGKGKENSHIKINDSDMIKVYRQTGTSTIITINLEGEDIDVLIHDFQKDPVNGNFLHIDFYAITLGQKVTATIRLNFVGKSPAEKEGAIIEESTKELEVSVFPRHLVDAIDVDLSLLKNIGDTIRIKDLDIDREKFILSNNEEDLVVMASEPKKAVVEDNEDNQSQELDESESPKEDNIEKEA